MRDTRRAAMLAVLIGASMALACGPVRAELVRCTDQRVEFLVGGAGQQTGRKMCAQAPSRASDTASTQPHRAVVVKPDDDGRRDILQQELRKEREALAAMDSSKRADAGTRESVAASEERARHVEDLKAIEAELRRLK